MKGIAFLTALLLAPSAVAAQAQSELQTGFMVHQWMQCPQQNVAEINRLTALSVPILNQLKDEGMIRAWYDVRHAWGDEWNVGFITVADSRSAWFDFWGEYVRRVSQAHPDLMAQFTALCTIHKDNMYAIRDSRGGSI